MSEMSDMFKLVNQMELAKKARVGMSLTYFDVIELLGELNSLYEYIDELDAERRWRVVADGELPEAETRVLVATPTGYMEVDWRFSEPIIDCGLANFYSLDNVTHWMPLPQPPEVQQ